MAQKLERKLKVLLAASRSMRLQQFVKKYQKKKRAKDI